MRARTKKRLMILGGVALLLLSVLLSQLPAIGAALILHPPRRHVVAATPSFCQDVSVQGEGVVLQGWRSQAIGKPRGTLIYLHGFADNRVSGAGVIERFRRRGFDVLAYDSRAHGESGGTAVTYGYFEKEDLRRVIDTLGPGPIVLLGSSLGGAVALQLAAEDPRVSAVVAAETFSDLRTVVTERAPFFFTAGVISGAIHRAEREGRFEMDAVNPARAARKITMPVLLIHGEADTSTPPEHSQRVFDRLAGVKRLILVPGARHNESLQGTNWQDIERWIDMTLGDSSGADGKERSKP